ncbi:MAG TPA: BMP family ABC transporter substrate-binding protein [Microbacteriaceae bacterium]|nr:BMP family ABC transporter substrate-binding protein [Microbacteriaceae bacterium]
MITTRKAVFGGLAVAATAALLAACAAPPATTPTEEPTTPVASDFLPCMVSDAGGFDDKSFNQLGADGIRAAAAAAGVEPILVESNDESDYGPNITSLVDQGCTIIVTVGFALSAATVEAALANPEVNFAIVDDAADNDFDGTVDAPNIKPLIFDTAQAAFLAGYAAAATSTSGVVGTYGGMNFPTVSIFMDGFAQGVDYYNSENSAAVKVVGWDRNNPEGGAFTGGFANDAAATATAQGIIDQGADVVLPVGGPIYLAAATIIQSSGANIALVGVDADVFETDPSVGPLLLTSVRKLIDVAVEAAVSDAAAGAFDSTPYIGTLENEGVGIAPFHDFESKVPADLGAKLETIAAGIIDGSIPVESYLAG